MSKPSEKAMQLKWPENIVADRHEVSGNWVLWYLTDAQADTCAAALNAPDARVQLLAKALLETLEELDEVDNALAVKIITKALAESGLNKETN